MKKKTRTRCSQSNWTHWCCPEGWGKTHPLCATGMLSRLRRGEPQGSAQWSTKHIWKQDSKSYWPLGPRELGKFQSAPPDGDITAGTKSYLVPKFTGFIIKHIACHFPKSLPSGTKHMSHPSLILEGWPEEGQRESTGCLGFLSAPTVPKVKVANIRRKFTVTQHMTSGDRQPRRYAWTHREGDRLQFVCAS